MDAVLRQQLDLALEEIERFKTLEVEQQQRKADEKARKRHVETNTPEMDITMIKSLSAQIKNKDIDLDLAKDALYRNWIHFFDILELNLSSKLESPLYRLQVID